MLFFILHSCLGEYRAPGPLHVLFPLLRFSDLGVVHSGLSLTVTFPEGPWATTRSTNVPWSILLWFCVTYCPLQPFYPCTCFLGARPLLEASCSLKVGASVSCIPGASMAWSGDRCDMRRCLCREVGTLLGSQVQPPLGRFPITMTLGPGGLPRNGWEPRRGGSRRVGHLHTFLIFWLMVCQRCCASEGRRGEGAAGPALPLTPAST